MGFYIMLAAFIIGIVFLFMSYRKNNRFRIINTVLGLIFIAIGIYLFWPK